MASLFFFVVPAVFSLKLFVTLLLLRICSCRTCVPGGLTPEVFQMILHFLLFHLLILFASIDVLYLKIEMSKILLKLSLFEALHFFTRTPL